MLDSLAVQLTAPQALVASSVESLVIDEADLILSYGHDEDMKAILSGGFLPSVFQAYLMSATMTKDVETLKGLVLRSPVSPFDPTQTIFLTSGRRYYVLRKTKMPLQI